MTVTLELKAEIEARVRAKAAEKGLPVERLIETVIESGFSRDGEISFQETATAEEWERALKNWISNFPARIHLL